MAKVLLIQAAVHSDHIERAQPLGLMSLASHLREERGDEILIYDMRPDWKNFELPLQAFQMFKPDVVGISAHGVDAPAMHRLAADIRKKSPETPIICGGVHATSYWKQLLEDEAITSVVISEGEHSFSQLLGTLESKEDLNSVAGIAFRDNRSPVRTVDREMEMDLDRFPFPAWDLIDLHAYSRFPRPGIFYKSSPYMAIETGRGCPYHCSWCHRSMGNRFRPHSSDYVLEMLEKLATQYNVHDLFVVDDMFNLDSERMDRIFEGVLERKLNLGFTLPIGIRADIISDESLALMKRAGVYKMMIAVETASPRLQKEMGKNLDLEKASHVIRTASRLGISTHGNFMIGLPTETEDEVWQTMRFAAHSRLDTFGLYRAIPFKGTRLHTIAIEQGKICADDEDTFSFWDLNVNLSTVSLNKLLFVRRIAYPYFYFRAGRLLRIIKHLPNPGRLLPFLLWFFFKKLIKK